MKTLIVYDSVFGNTEQVALAIGTSLGGQERVDTLRIGEVTPEHLKGVGLLIVGSPTRGFRPTKAITSFLNGISPNGLAGVRAAAFDTRISTVDVHSRFLNVMMRLFGYAAEPIANMLKGKGGLLVLPPEGFFVRDSEGPLKDGELERAADWASQAAKTEQPVIRS